MRRYPYGSDIELLCTSEGGPQLEYNWIFLDNAIVNNAILNISNIAVSHGGEYTCNVTNNAGSESNMTTVYSELKHNSICLSDYYLFLNTSVIK